MKTIRAGLLALITFTASAQAEIAIQPVISPGGINAWLVEESAFPFTALEIRFRGGMSIDPVEQRGVINLMTALIDDGAGDLDAESFANARDALAAKFSFDASDDNISVSARFLTEDRDEAIDLLRLALTEPRFDADAIERARGQVLSRIQSDQKDPDTIAGDLLDSMAFGAHPYGSSGMGTAQSVAALTRADLQAALSSAMTRDNIYVAATGDINAEDLGILLDNLLGDLPATGAPAPERADWALEGGITVVDFPSPLSLVYFEQQGMKRSDPDFFAAYIINEIMGGGRFSARLMTEVREKRGLTYGIGSYLVPQNHAEILLGMFASGNDTTAEAIDLVKAEWAKMADNGISEEELTMIKTYLTGSFPLQFDGNAQIARILVDIQMDDLPLDYVQTRNARIEAVTTDDIARVANQLLQPENLHFMVVGQPEGLTTTP